LRNPRKNRGNSTRLSRDREPKTADTKEEQEGPTPGEEIYAIFADRFYVVATTTITRIAFGEAPTGMREYYRTAVVLPTKDAKELAELVLRLIRELEMDDAERP
jgi:hypothetical protein